MADFCTLLSNELALQLVPGWKSGARPEEQPAARLTLSRPPPASRFPAFRGGGGRGGRSLGGAALPYTDTCREGGRARARFPQRRERFGRPEGRPNPKFSCVTAGFGSGSVVSGSCGASGGSCEEKHRRGSNGSCKQAAAQG